jgi:hypothetical protein
MSDRLKTDRLFAGSTTLGFCTADLLSWALKGRDGPLEKSLGAPVEMGRRDSFFIVSDSHVESSQTFWSANPGNSMTHLFARFLLDALSRM